MLQCKECKQRKECLYAQFSNGIHNLKVVPDVICKKCVYQNVISNEKKFSKVSRRYISPNKDDVSPILYY